MLRFLRIRNLAVIEAAEIEFEPGFNVLTGETGAGKSILVEAVGLLLGGRATADLVRTGEARATIEAIFDDQGRELIVSREITSQGRSRSFINGALATAGALRDLSVRLVELHGQHEQHALLDPQAHLPILDDFAGLGELAGAVAAAWAEVRTLREQLERSRMDARERTARLDLVQFQLGEIQKVAPRAGEDDELATTRQILASAERVQRLCAEGYHLLYERDDAVLAGLAGVWKRVDELAGIDPAFAAYLEPRETIRTQLDDLARFLRDYADGVEASADRLQEVEDRLAALERLKRKYGPSLSGVVDRGAVLARELALLSDGGDLAENIQLALDDASARYLGVATQLSRRRHDAAPVFARRLEEMLASLAMSRTRFEVRFAPALAEGAWGERGIDDAQFYVSPNPGEDLRPLARIASGGELSRVMLAVKTLAAGDGGDRTLIFDEVDVGIGGRVADVVGERLRALGGRFQVLCITHLPQIAAYGTTQFRIDKAVRSGRTATSVERLGPEGRVEEIARMIGGAAVTDAVRASARDLLAAPQAASATGRTATRAKGKSMTKGESESGRRG